MRRMGKGVQNLQDRYLPRMREAQTVSKTRRDPVQNVRVVRQVRLVHLDRYGLVSRICSGGVQNGYKTENRCAEAASKFSEMFCIADVQNPRVLHKAHRPHETHWPHKGIVQSQGKRVQNERGGCPKCPSRPTGLNCPTSPSWTRHGGLVSKISVKVSKMIIKPESIVHSDSLTTRSECPKRVIEN